MTSWNQGETLSSYLPSSIFALNQYLRVSFFSRQRRLSIAGKNFVSFSGMTVLKTKQKAESRNEVRGKAEGDQKQSRKWKSETSTGAVSDFGFLLSAFSISALFPGGSSADT